MKDYILVSDSTADLPADIVKQLDVCILPFSYSIEDEVYLYYLDERDGDIRDFYQKLRDGAMPVTSQVNPMIYKDFFEKYVKEGKAIVYLSFTSGLSGSYASSLTAIDMIKEDYPDAKICAIDSYAASVGEGAFLYEAAKKKQAGAEYDELVAWIRSRCRKVSHWFMVEDLFHLKRGGRVSTVEAVLGSALKIKPILSVDEEGKLVVKAKTRGQAKALNYLRDKTVEEGGDLSKLTAVIGNADAMESAEKLKSMMIEVGMKDENILIAPIGPIIGTHVGPGMVAIAFVRPDAD